MMCNIILKDMDRIIAVWQCVSVQMLYVTAGKNSNTDAVAVVSVWNYSGGNNFQRDIGQKSDSGNMHSRYVHTVKSQSDLDWTSSLE